MRFRKKRLLGLALAPDSVTAAEVALSGSRRKLARAASFEFPEGISFENPSELGAALGAFLRKQALTVRDAAIGLPAQWLMFKNKSVPPASRDALAGMLRLEAERDFSFDLSDLEIDYVDGGGAGEERQVLLVAVPRKRLEQVHQMAEAAGLQVAAITASTMALASATVDAPENTLLSLFMGRTGSELAVTRGPHFRLVRQLTASPVRSPDADIQAWLSRIANEVRQSLSLLPHSAEAAAPGNILIWDGVGLNSDFPDGLTRRLPLEASVCQGLERLGISESPSSSETESRKFSPAAAVALTQLEPALPSVDFKNSRLAVRPQRRVGRKAVWALFLALSLAAAGYQMYSDWEAARLEVQELETRMADLKPDIDAAQKIMSRVATARKWFDQRPAYLDCLRDLTLAFPEKGLVWASTLTIQDDFRGVLSGKAEVQRAILHVIDNMKKSGAFSNVKVMNMREAGRGTRTISFSVSFLYRPGRPAR